MSRLFVAAFRRLTARRARHSLESRAAMLWLPFGVLTLLAPPPAADEATPLWAGSSLSREMAGGETHHYALELREREYLQVDLDQQGVDVTATVTGPDGAVLLEADNPSGPIGPEPVALIAGATGIHRLAVKAGDLAAPAGRLPGSGSTCAESRPRGTGCGWPRCARERTGRRPDQAIRARCASTSRRQRPPGASWASAASRCGRRAWWVTPMRSTSTSPGDRSNLYRTGARDGQGAGRGVRRGAPERPPGAGSLPARPYRRDASADGAVARAAPGGGAHPGRRARPDRARRLLQRDRRPASGDRSALRRPPDLRGAGECPGRGADAVRDRRGLSPARGSRPRPGAVPARLAGVRARSVPPRAVHHRERRGPLPDGRSGGRARGLRRGALDLRQAREPDRRSRHAAVSRRRSARGRRHRGGLRVLRGRASDVPLERLRLGVANALCRFGDTSLALGDAAAARAHFTAALAIGDAAGAAALGCAELGLARVESAAERSTRPSRTPAPPWRGWKPRAAWPATACASRRWPGAIRPTKPWWTS